MQQPQGGRFNLTTLTGENTMPNHLQYPDLSSAPDEATRLKLIMFSQLFTRYFGKLSAGEWYLLLNDLLAGVCAGE